MGMSASQVRFLSLQCRKNNIGKELLTLSNRKMALSRDMSAVALRFNNALNQTTLKWSTDSGSSYTNLTYDLMMRPNELNAETPYIVTKANTGEVVLNNDPIKDINGNIITKADGTALTYVDIAKMISGYSGVDGQGVIHYNNVASRTQDDGTVYGNKAIDNAYYIPNATRDFSFDSCLRYEIFERMGLITEADKKQHLSLLTALYGSAEAQETGIFPVGSAWGDYYIALANLEAYEDFIMQEHELSNAGTFNGSNKTSASFDYASRNYSYKSDINGTNVGENTVITQSTNQGAVSHVDFSKFVKQNAAGFYEENTSTNADFNSYDQSFSDLALTGTYGIDVSTSGITYKYGVEDMLTNALKNYRNTHGRNGTYMEYFAWMENPDATSGNIDGTNWDRNVSVYHKVNQYYLGANEVYSKVDAPLRNICDQFIDLLSYQNLTQQALDTSALQKAKEATVKRFKDTWSDESNADNCCNPSIDAVENAYANGGHNGLAIARHKFHMHFGWYPSFHRARIDAAVDLKAMFNVFMTYYQHYASHPNQGTSSVSTGIPEYERFELLGDEVSQGSYNWNNSYCQEISKGSVYTTYDRMKMTAVADANIDVNTFEFDGVGGFREARPNIFPYNNTDPQFRIDSGARVESLTFRNDKSGESIYINSTHGTKTVYGNVAVSEGTTNKIYYFTSVGALNNYINNGTLSGSNVIEITLADSTVSTSGINQTLRDDGYDTIILNQYANATKYDITINEEVTENTIYHAQLRQAVEDAMRRIQDIETDLSYVYGSADQKLMDYYDALFQRIAEQGWIVDQRTSVVSNPSTASNYLNNKLQNNDYFITECNEKADETGYKYASKMATSVKKVFSVHDSDAESEALAEYEAEKSLIALKEQKIDARMQKLETEQEAINTTMESIQRIIKENIEKAFKMFA